MMTRIRAAATDWFNTTRLPLGLLIPLLIPLLVVGAIVWMVAVSLLIMFMLGLPMITIGVFFAGWDMVSPGWDLIILAVSWVIWWPIFNRLST